MYKDSGRIRWNRSFSNDNKSLSFVSSLVIIVWLVAGLLRELSNTSQHSTRDGPVLYATLAQFEDTPPPVESAIAKGKEVWLLESYSSLSEGRTNRTLAELYVICRSDSVSACVLKESLGRGKEARWSFLNMNGVISGEGPEWLGQREPDGTIHLTTSSSGYTDLSRYGDGRRSRLEGIKGERWHSTATIVIRGDSWSRGGSLSSKLEFNSFTMPTSYPSVRGSGGKARRL